MLLAFAPFVAFAVAVTAIGSIEALLLGAAVSGLLILFGLAKRRSAKILEIGSLLLLSGLAACEHMSGATLSLIGAKLADDLGLLCVIVLSMLVGMPFTMQSQRMPWLRNSGPILLSCARTTSSRVSGLLRFS